MAGEVRQRMIEGAVQLLAQHGFQGTSFANVIELTGAPRGSIYYHFPDGKNELVEAALDLANARAISILGEAEDDTPVAIAERFIGLWRALLRRTDFAAGCSVLGTVVTADSAAVLDRAAQIFRDWRESIAGQLTRSGLTAEQASRLAALLIAACEGAVVLCRAERSMEPLDAVAAELIAHVTSAAARSTAA